MSTIARISSALGYDVPEQILASGEGTLAAALAWAANKPNDYLTADEAPLSYAPTMVAPTVRPLRMAR